MNWSLSQFGLATTVDIGGNFWPSTDPGDFPLPPSPPNYFDDPVQPPPAQTNTGKYVCRKRQGSDGSSQEGPYEDSGDGTGCCLDGRCTYDCTAVEGGDQDPEGVPIEFKFKICGDDKDHVNSQQPGNHLSYFCPDTIELNMTTYRNGTYSTNDIPMGSPPRNLGFGN
jgi:hypothetical protein